MHFRNSFRFTNLAVAFCFLLAFTIFPAASRYAEAQTPAAHQGNQGSAQSGSLVVLANHTPRKVLNGTATRIDHYNPEQKLRLAIFVTPRDLAGQEKLLNELQDKKSPNFHKWLSADEWNARFGPLAENEQAVVDWASSQGLTVTNRFANRMLVDVEAPAGVIEQALNVTINHYQVGEEVDFSNDRDPSIPAHLSGIVGGIFGLNSIERLKPASSQRTEARHPDYVPGPVFNKIISGHGEGDPSKAPWAQQASIGGGGLTSHAQSLPPSSEGVANPNPADELGGINPSNLYSSQGYDLGALMSVSKCCNVHNDSTGSPADTSIALVTFGGFQYSDYTAFTTYYGMAWNIDAYQIDGAGSPTSTTECQIDVSDVSSSCPGDGLDDEADLDTEWSTAFANSYGSYLDTAHVYVYEGSGNYFSNFFDTWNYVLSDAHAHVISTSYAWTEELFQSEDPGWIAGTAEGDAHYIFNALVGQGNTLIAAAGDQGPTSGCTNADQVFWPADDPDFLAAGGTSLNLNYDGSFGSETAWVGGTTLKDCQGNGGGGGGGISELFSAPSWQSGITYEEMDDGNDYIVSGQPNRMMPDLSLNATGNFQWDYCTTPACKNTSPDGWATWGGTSIVAPELAGFYAQVNSYLNSIGHICGSGTSACEPIGNPDPVLYYEGMGQAAPHNPFYDTTQDCVTNYLTAQNPDLLYFCATTGYDLATGWGSANLLQLAWAYNFYIIPADGVPSVTFTGGPATGTSHWYNTDQEISWTVSDSDSSATPGLPAPGVAGFTQGWDSIPADVYSEPNGGSGNSFYSGPQYPYGTTGCLSFNGLNGCAGNGGAQGCHTVNVGAWDNQGFYTGAKTYGPVCYDTVVPTITSSTSPALSGWLDQSVVVTLNATDPGGSDASGINKTYYAVNNETTCAPGSVSGCSVYSGPVTISAQGQSTFYYFTEDKAGNWSTWWYITISIDTTKPVTTASLSGTISSGSIYQTAVKVTLSASTTGGSGVANTYYELDGGSQTTYSGAFTVSALGSHSVKFWSVSGSGEVESAHTVSFSIASPTTAALVATPNPALLGGSVKMTATITATLSGTPTGTVTFWNGATNLGTGTLSGGVATLSTTALPAGFNTLQVSYPATGNFLATNSAPFDETVHENTTTTVTSSLNPSVYGQTVTLTATVTPSSSGTPTGSVSFYNGSTLVGFESLNSSGVATLPTNSLPGGVLSIKGVYSGDSTYLTSTSAVLSQTVNKASQTISFAALPAVTYGVAPFTISATASSGLTVGLASATTTVCTVSGTTVTIVAAGNCTIWATQAGNADYAEATAVSQTFAVHGEAQTITFAAIPNTPLATGSVTLDATASSGLPVSFTSTTTSVCTVSASTVTLVAAGTCSIEAKQAGTTGWDAAAPVTRSFKVLASQTITFPAIAAVTYGVAPFSLSATASSGLAVSFASATKTVCTVSGTTATIVAAGNCTIWATQAGNTEYAEAPAVSQTFTVHGEPQTITFPAIANTPLVTGTITLDATASSGLPVSYTSTTTTVCTVSASTVTLVAVGPCSIEAKQAGTTGWDPAAPVTRSFRVLASQTITFPAIAAVTYGVAPFGLSATASSGLAVTFASATKTVCTVSGTTATIVAAGNCTIWATQAGNTEYAEATAVSQTFAVHGEAQTITFPAIPSTPLATGTVTLDATASSGLAVSYTSTTTSVCTVSASTVTLLAAGTCTIEAKQAGNTGWDPAPTVTRSFAVTATAD